LLSGTFPDWPSAVPELAHFSPQDCGNAMKTWEKFTAIGAIGPDLFYFSQDYNSAPLGPLSDELMLSLQTYYFFDAAKEDDWEPLLIILDGVNSTIAALLRFLIKLQKIWQAFVDGWNKTIGPVVSSLADSVDALTGGLLNEFGVVLNELKTALVTLGKEELLTFADIFSRFDTCVQKGFDEKAFLWSDMSHYRRPSALCRSLVKEAINLQSGEDGANRSQQFLAFALGYITHVGTDTVAHSFVNEQCGGPFRDHPQRHHLIENHIDAWNYSQTGDSGKLAADPWGKTDTYPDLTMSALWFAVQFTPDEPRGKQRPATLPDDPADRKKALDVDGEMPLWMAESFVKALKDAFGGGPHPLIFGGDSFQSTIDGNLLTKVIEAVTGSGPDRPLPELLADICPKPSFAVPRGFPLPWQIQTMYRIMITFYKFQFNGNWELQKPRKPPFIIVPPASDFEQLLQPPDFSGVDSSNPAAATCEAIIAFFEWIGKELGAAITVVNDLVRLVTSPGTYLFRLGLYELASMVWDVITKTHDILAHTGFYAPHSEQHYDDNGELRLPNEIDLPLITLGGTVDGAFRAALAAAIDPFGNLDDSQSAIGDSHSVRDPNYPYYPVERLHQTASGTVDSVDAWEFKRPWAYPQVDPDGGTTPTETYEPHASDSGAPPGAYKPLRPGPYPVGTMPDVFFRLDAPVDASVRSDYESATTPFATDRLNEAHVPAEGRAAFSPLGDPVPFSSYLIGRLANETNYITQFNLDSDRAFAYLTWDWIRQDAATGAKGTPDGMGSDFTYVRPVIAPAGTDDKQWNPATPLQVLYVDAPIPPEPPGGDVH
jgi:hypothetical protein